VIKFSHNIFDGNRECTIGMDFTSKNVKVGDHRVKLQIWDTAGHERWESIIPTSYMKGAMAVVAVYDVTSQASYEHVVWKWMQHVENACDKNTVLYWVGSKCDLVSVSPQSREVSTALAERDAQKVGAYFFETSAKTGKNVNELFQAIAEQMLICQSSSKNHFPSHDDGRFPTPNLSRQVCQCRGSVEPDSACCNKCNKMQLNEVCNGCGSVLAPEANFCTHCGGRRGSRRCPCIIM
jgi:small GTP-binding protein